ncbi:hypothetical protein Taro_020323, partial [Colocasia esculenta]|nr:hypothetical protein [Colocasia esculenta]
LGNEGSLERDDGGYCSCCVTGRKGEALVRLHLLLLLLGRASSNLGDGPFASKERTIRDAEEFAATVIQAAIRRHLVYGMLMARSTYERMKIASRERRPFVLTRAGFIGSQQYAATWTGDNLSNGEHLHMSIPMVLQLSLSGQPLSGPNIGGFAGNASP